MQHDEQTAGGASFFWEWRGTAGLGKSTALVAEGRGRNETGVAELQKMRINRKPSEAYAVLK